MTNTLIEISEDEFDQQYPLVTNHLNPHAGWAFGDGHGCLFETNGQELQFVRRQNPATIWTFVDGDDGQYVISGFHLVNRIGYLVSTIPVPEGSDIQVRIESPDAPPPEAVLPSPHDKPMPELQPATPQLVPKGTRLDAGKMYLRLYHGRTDPAQEMDDWGFVGPTFGPLSCYVHTYCSTFRIHGEDGTSELWLERHDDMIVWEGCFYGDMELFIACSQDRA